MFFANPPLFLLPRGMFRIDGEVVVKCVSLSFCCPVLVFFVLKSSRLGMDKKGYIKRIKG